MKDSLSSTLQVLLISCLMSATLFGSGITDSLGFVSPVDHQIRLTGNFMELRPNHFHAGIDIKSSNGQPGDVIRSVHEGHISRIKVQSGGYGNVLYIDHPNGYTSVYAHLHTFIPEIKEFVEEVQYRTESFEVDIYLPDSLFSLSKSQQIGTMGNTGRSFGPHLHFELRETRKELPVNPEILGIGPEDTSAPKLESLHLHIMDVKGEVSDKSVKYFKTKEESYSLHSDLVTVKGTKLGLALQMYDRMDGSWNKNGVYSFEVKVDGIVEFAWSADKFSFDETRLINAFWDYERKKIHGQKVYLLYRSSCNPFSYYSTDSHGIIDLSDGVERDIAITVSDVHKNKSFLRFKVKGNSSSESETQLEVEENISVCDSSSSHRAGHFLVEFDERSFYSPVSLDLRYDQVDIHGQKCPAIQIGKPTMPVNGYYKLSCPIPTSDLDRWTIVSKDGSRLVHFGADTLDGKLVSYIDQMGEFYLYKDSVPPKVQTISFSKDLSSPWKFKITDNLIPDGRVGDLYYRGTLNGRWIKLNYDKKSDILMFDDFNKTQLQPSGNNQFELYVEDDCSNATVYRREF